MSIKYHVRLTDDEQAMLEALIKQKKPKVAQHKKCRAGILLAIDENQPPLTHEQVAKAYCVSAVFVNALSRKGWKPPLTASLLIIATSVSWVW